MCISRIPLFANFRGQCGHWRDGMVVINGMHRHGEESFKGGDVETERSSRIWEETEIGR